MPSRHGMRHEAGATGSAIRSNMKKMMPPCCDEDHTLRLDPLGPSHLMTSNASIPLVSSGPWRSFSCLTSSMAF